MPPPLSPRKRAREIDQEESNIRWNERREELLSGNLSLEEAVRLSLESTGVTRQRIEKGQDMPFGAMWRSIFSSQASTYLKERGKFLASDASTPILISQDDIVVATLEITLNASGQMVSHDIPVHSFWEIIFSPAGRDYLRSRGLLVGEVIESSTSTSATLSDLPNTQRNLNMELHGSIHDILQNPIQVGPDLVLPQGTNEIHSSEANETNDNGEQNSPVETTDSDPRENITRSREGENITEVEQSEESLETLNIRVSNNGSVTQSSSNGGYETGERRPSTRRMTTHEYKRSLLSGVIGISSSDSAQASVILNPHLPFIAHQHHTDTLRSITMRRYINLHDRKGSAVVPKQPPRKL